jgi:hypothetical protein
MHEYAHLHVARHFGVHGHVTIEANPDGGLYESHYVGQLHVFTLVPTAHGRAMVGLAGFVAEWLCENPVITAEDLFAELDLDPESLSESDRRYAPNVTPRTVGAALWLVRKLWPDIVADAELHASAEARIAGLQEVEAA